MPPLPDVPNVLKVIHTGTICAQPWATISHWRFVSTGGAPDAASLNAVCAKFVNSWRDNIRPWCTSACIDSGVEAIDLTSVTAATGTALDGDAGSGDTNTVSPESCMLVTKTASLRYRGGHPRTYWPGTGKDHTVGGLGRTLDFTRYPPFETSFVTYYSDIPPAVTTDTDCRMTSFHEVMVSYHHAGALRTVPLVTDIVGYRLQQVCATQRRRMHRT